MCALVKSQRIANRHFFPNCLCLYTGLFGCYSLNKMDGFMENTILQIFGETVLVKFSFPK